VSTPDSSSYSTEGESRFAPAPPTDVSVADRYPSRVLENGITGYYCGQTPSGSMGRGPDKRTRIEQIVDSVSRQLRYEWDVLAQQSYNPNTKGGAFERSIAQFLSEFLGSVYDLKTRAAVIDERLDVFETFDYDQVERDVVGTYAHMVPQLKFQVGSINFVPYKHVAFVCEVKASPGHSDIESDLETFEKLRALGDGSDRFVMPNAGSLFESSDTHQLLCLIYHDRGITPRDIELFEERSDLWDLALFVDENELLANRALTYTDSVGRLGWTSDHENLVRFGSDGILWFILHLCHTTPQVPIIEPSSIYSTMLWECRVAPRLGQASPDPTDLFADSVHAKMYDEAPEGKLTQEDISELREESADDMDESSDDMEE
jgi:hypothetical protein